MAASLAINDYLQKNYYKKEKKKTKHKKKRSNGQNDKLRIVDADVLLFDQNLHDESDEEQPQVEIVDDRPIEIRWKEKLDSSRWKVLDDVVKQEPIDFDDQPSTSSLIVIKQEPVDYDEFDEYQMADSISEERRAGRQRHDSSDSNSSTRNQPHQLIAGNDASASTNRQTAAAESDQSPPRRARRRHDSIASDQSLPRKNAGDDAADAIDSDLSPPRRRRDSSESDLDVRRKTGRNKQIIKKEEAFKSKSSDDLKVKKEIVDDDDDDDLELPRRREKPSKTLSGASAGLQSATDMQIESESMRNKARNDFQMMSDEVSGRNAAPVVRKGIISDRRKGKKREPTEEEKERQRQLDEQYKKFNKGLVQLSAAEAQKADLEYEYSKPMARDRSDVDLERHLKEKELHDDPMLDYMRKKRAKMDNRPAFPKYKGPPPPPNRFSIVPGYRWDGVNRSNGFEEKLLGQKNEQNADRDEFYKWSYGFYE